MAKAKKKTNSKAKHVIVRTYSAGVHYGILVAQNRNGKRVILRNARRIWSWEGANTLNEIALRGVGAGSKISEAVREIAVTEAIEVITCEPAAIANLDVATWGTP